jgi:hypothetical protein
MSGTSSHALKDAFTVVVEGKAGKRVLVPIHRSLFQQLTSMRLAAERAAAEYEGMVARADREYERACTEAHEQGRKPPRRGAPPPPAAQAVAEMRAWCEATANLLASRVVIRWQSALGTTGSLSLRGLQIPPPLCYRLSPPPVKLLIIAHRDAATPSSAQQHPSPSLTGSATGGHVGSVAASGLVDAVTDQVLRVSACVQNRSATERLTVRMRLHLSSEEACGAVSSNDDLLGKLMWTGSLEANMELEPYETRVHDVMLCPLETGRYVVSLSCVETCSQDDCAADRLGRQVWWAHSPLVLRARQYGPPPS